jgi:hypothetical protein
MPTTVSDCTFVVVVGALVRDVVHVPRGDGGGSDAGFGRDCDATNPRK